MSVSRMLNESLPNMVAAGVMFLKAHLVGRIGGADDALEEDYPTTLLDADEEELDTLNRAQMRELEVLQKE